MNKRVLTLTLIVVCFLITDSVYAQFTKKKKWKAGINRTSISVSYDYSTKTLSSETVTTADTNVSESSSGSVSGTEIWGEWLTFGGYFGLELDLGLSPGTRNFTLKTTGKDGEDTKIGDVEESVLAVYAFGFNIYFADHKEPGFKPYISYMMGTYSVTHSYTNGGERDDDEADPLTGFPSSGSSTKSISATIMKAGIDWIRADVGFRLQYLSITGSAESDSLPKTTITDAQKQEEEVQLSSGFGLGIFVSF